MSPSEHSTDGLVTVPSAHSADETVARLTAALAEKHLHLFVHIDHAAGAQKVGLSLRPVQVLIFGNPEVGTPLMQSTQLIGLDLPLRVLVWEDSTGKVWMTYTQPEYLVRRYGITDRAREVATMSAGLAAITHAASSQ
jgi:uncharacterized protein (DUF302 family)